MFLMWVLRNIGLAETESEVILQILRAVEREEVTREIKIILAFFLVQKLNWASGLIPKRAFYLGHRVLPMGITI